MSLSFIPSLHFESPEKKLTSEWCLEAKGVYYHNSVNKNLLSGKKIKEIDEYADGNFSMTPFLRMFKSNRKLMEKNGAVLPTGVINEDFIANNSTVGIEWKPLPLIPIKLNSAVSTVQKIPIEVECEAMDAVATKKRDDDILFLKNKPTIEAELQPIADELDIGEVDLGGPKNGGNKYSSEPNGLDLSEPDEEDIFRNVIYSLRVETAFEKALQQFYNLSRAEMIKLLEIRDQFKYGVSVNWPRRSSMTGLPELQYLHPQNVECPESDLPDFSDNTHRVINQRITILEMFNAFGEDIQSEKHLEEIINGKGGWCDGNQKGGEARSISTAAFAEAKVNLKYFEIKTIDWIGVVDKKGGRGMKYFTTDESRATRKLYAQNTIGFWWLVNTKYCFGIHRLDNSYREPGSEAYQCYSTNISKSQQKSAVELSIGENKKAQIADIKWQHALIMSAPAGKYVDLRYMRNALSALVEDEGKPQYVIGDLINLFFEKNFMIGDTEGFDGKNDGQMKPFMEIPGGLRDDVNGYINTIMVCQQNIANYTGINEQLTGQSANPEGLVGMQKLLINSSLNALYYCNEAIRNQYQKVFNMWASIIKDAIERGGETKKAIIKMIGIDDTNIIDGLEQLKLHELTIHVKTGQREEERQKYLEQLTFLKQKGVITAADEYMLSGVTNPKDQMALLAIKEKKFMRKMDQIRAEEFQNAQAIKKQEGENAVSVKAAENEGKINQTYAKGETEAKLMELGEQLGLTRRQQEAVIKRLLQRERGEQQIQKAVETIKAKEESKNREPLSL